MVGKPLCYHASDPSYIPCGGQAIRSPNFLMLWGQLRENEYRIIPGSPMIKVVPIDHTGGMTARKVPSIPGRQVAPRPTNLTEPYGSVV